MKISILLIIIFLPFLLFSQDTKSIHLIVTLCDNENQGIVPVPEILGDGTNPSTNLYWGALYGVKTYFKSSKHWDLILEQKHLDSAIIERVVFKHDNTNAFLIADAYYGHEIELATTNIINSGFGEKEDQIEIKHESASYQLGLYAKANLLAYIGHNGLMDFDYEYHLNVTEDKSREVIILACKSKLYFGEHFVDSNVNPIIVTTGLMAPEAYTLESVLEGWIKNEPKDELRLRAAKAYDKYQKCGLNAAKNLFDTKW
jgi:hypothetical protein